MSIDANGWFNEKEAFWEVSGAENPAPSELRPRALAGQR
jgi:hypothetical protein